MAISFRTVADDDQRALVNRLLCCPRYMAWLLPGYGKTICALSAFDHLREHTTDTRRALVIAPPLVARTTWPQERDKWGITATIAVANSPDEKERMEILKDPGNHIVTLSLNLVPWLFDQTQRRVKRMPAIGKLGFDTLIIDESALLCSPTSRRAKPIIRAVDQGTFLRVWELTGGPMPNDRLLELWTQYRIALGTKSPLGANFNEYRREICYAPLHENTHEWEERPSSRESVLKAVAPFTFHSRRKGDAAIIPPVVEREQRLPLNEAALAARKTAIKDWILEFGEREEDNILIESAAGLVGKLQQIHAGFYFHPKQYHPETMRELPRVWTELDPVKLEALSDLYDSIRGGGKLLVQYWFHNQPARVSQFLNETVPVGKSPEVLDAWCADEIDLMLIHPASAGHGLNLQVGKKPVQILRLDGMWSADKTTQLTARIARRGYTASPEVIVHNLLSGTKGIPWVFNIDARALSTVRDRTDGMHSAMLFVQDLREQYLQTGATP